ncbi:MAG: hypothetical protein LBU83_02075 [Bacteroidales bacterium]|jgi:hypothetical protein|nr:hypothetical protein [Bacteroidales bacterium]
MINSEHITIILTSTLVASIVSILVTHITILRQKRVDFRNEYYKIILAKRLKAYQFVETQIAVLKSVVVESDGKPYHVIFSYGEDKFIEFQQNLLLAISYGLWIDDGTMKELEKLNELFFSLNNQIRSKAQNEILNVGKIYYQKISDTRLKLENSVIKGLYELHDVRKILRTQKTNTVRIFYP